MEGITQPQSPSFCMFAPLERELFSLTDAIQNRISELNSGQSEFSPAFPRYSRDEFNVDEICAMDDKSLISFFPFFKALRHKEGINFPEMSEEISPEIRQLLNHSFDDASSEALSEMITTFSRLCNIFYVFPSYRSHEILVNILKGILSKHMSNTMASRIRDWLKQNRGLFTSIQDRHQENLATVEFWRGFKKHESSRHLVQPMVFEGALEELQAFLTLPYYDVSVDELREMIQCFLGVYKIPWEIESEMSHSALVSVFKSICAYGIEQKIGAMSAELTDWFQKNKEELSFICEMRLDKVDLLKIPSILNYFTSLSFFSVKNFEERVFWDFRVPADERRSIFDVSVNQGEGSSFF